MILQNVVLNFGTLAVLKTKMSQSAELGSTLYQLDPPFFFSSPHFYYFLFIPTVTVMLRVTAIRGLQKCTHAVIHSLWLWLFTVDFRWYFNTNIWPGDLNSHWSCSLLDVLKKCAKFMFRNVLIIGPLLAYYCYYWHTDNNSIPFLLLLLLGSCSSENYGTILSILSFLLPALVSISRGESCHCCSPHQRVHQGVCATSIDPKLENLYPDDMVITNVYRTRF